MSTDARQVALLSGPERRDILRHSIAMISSSQLATVCGAVTHLVLRTAIEPGLMGIWSLMRTVLEYGTYSSLGINRSAGRDIAIAAGRGDMTLKDRLADVAMTLEVATGALVGMGLASAAVFQAHRASYAWAAAFGVAAVIAVVGRYHAFSLTVLRSQKQFPVLSRARVAGALADLTFMAVGGYCFHFFGLVAGAVWAQIFNAWYVRYVGALRFRAVGDRLLALGLLVSGWPIAAEALALAALRSVDRLVIVNCLPNGAEQLGWYSVAMVLGAWAFDQSNLIANVIYPRLGEALGRTSDPAVVLRLGLRAAEVIALAMVPCSALLLAVGVPTLDWLLPRYRPGLIAAGGLVAGSALLGVSMPLRYALVTVGRTVPMLAATTISAGLSLVGGVTILSQGGSLRQVAWNSAAAAAICLALMLILSSVDRRELWPVAVRVMLAGAYAMSGVILLGCLGRMEGAAWALAAAWCVLPTWQLARHIDWKSLLRAPS